jgi:hypothetical protein
MLIVNAVQAFDAVIVDEVCVTVTVSADAHTADINRRNAHVADLIPRFMLRWQRTRLSA